jgi:phenylalanyl-tRNA synthetase beta chain
MRVGMDWIRDMVELPSTVTGRQVADRLIAAGLEVESVEVLGSGVEGDLYVGRVVEIEELKDFKKPIRWCQVDMGSALGGVRGIICGARNFSAGDRVVVALPGTILPGNFRIAARETYGHVSDGMICSERELALGEDHAGIIVLDEGNVGDDAAELLGIGIEVLDIAVTPDRGYALSVRGISREVAIAYGLPFNDPGTVLVDLPAPGNQGEPWPCGVDDPTVADLFTLRRIINFDPGAPSPAWMRRRLVACGMRPISLAVDVTNYVMLELGQPLHAFDGAKITGPIRASRANGDSRLTTLDHVERPLAPEDIVIRDDTGPIGLAGTMGGFLTEIDDDSTDLVLEAAHFDSVAVARTARRHRLSSEASRRFERGVDRVLAPYASARAAALLLEHGGGTYVGMTAWEAPYNPTTIRMAADQSTRTSGMEISSEVVQSRLAAIGCKVSADANDQLRITVPPWRPDLNDPADCVEEVIRLGGYDSLPSTLPLASAGFGLTREQRLRRRAALALAGAGFVEILSYPFVGEADFASLSIDESDIRRRAVRLANPLSEEQPFLRTTLLPGLFAAARRSISRGTEDLALFEMGSVFILDEGQVASGTVDPPRPEILHRPTDSQLEQLQSLLPLQPRHLAVLLTGERLRSGWWGPGIAASWRDAISAVRLVAEEVGASITVRQGEDSAFHPGRTAVLEIAGQIIGVAGELHPRVIAACDLPPRSAAMELNLTALLTAARDVAPAPVIGTQPVAKEDLALVVSKDIPAIQVAQAVSRGAGELCESVRLFDVYEGPQVPEGHRSLAFALRLRAPDRTLSADDISRVREGALGQAQRDCGAVLRGS